MELLIEQGSHWDTPYGEMRFANALADDVLLLHKVPTGETKFVQRAEFVKLLGEEKIRQIKLYKRRKPFIALDGSKAEREVLQECNDNEVFGPDEETGPEALRARTFQFYVKAYDKDPSVRLSKRSLGVFIHQLRPQAEERGLTHNVKPARLYAAIKNCGAPGDRPLRLFRSRRGKGTRKRLDEFVLGALDRACALYWRNRTWDYNDAYAAFRGEMRRENERRDAAGEPRVKYPKRMETLRRRITAGICHQNWKLKYGAREADHKFKGVRAGLSAERPLELVIMDHTVCKTFTVLDTSTYIPFKGRATLTVAIDVATRMPLGHLISFEPPSLYSVMTTLKRVNKNKDYIKKVFADIVGKWDGWGHPETLLVDNGLEFTSPSIKDALEDIGTEVVWAPVRTPEYKAIGERFFRTLDTMLFDKLPGSAVYDPKTMSALGLDPSKEAVISLGDLDRLIHQVIITYTNEEHSGIDNAVPAVVWEQKIRRYGRRFIPDLRQLNSMLGQVHTGQITRNGVRFRNMRFRDQKAVSYLLDSIVKDEPKRSQSGKRLSSARANIKFKYNPGDASSIEVWNHGGTPKHYVTLPNADARFASGISFWQAERIRDYAIEKKLPFDTDEQKWEAREALRKYYDSLWAERMRDRRDARRSAAQSMGTYEEADNAPDQQPIRIRTSEVVVDVDEAPLVPTAPPAGERDDDTEPAAGFAPSKASVKKAKETRERKRKEQEQQEKEEAKAKAARESAGKVDLNANGQTSYAERLKQKMNWQTGSNGRKDK
ncbi:transposase family protein [Rhodopseudomonas palustris]|nr:transposase family protein [Rhodopseudomonas palustris]